MELIKYLLGTEERIGATLVVIALVCYFGYLSIEKICEAVVKIKQLKEKTKE
jgi:hypothetical protein